MNLSVLERIKLLEVLPATGNILTLRIVRKLREDLSFSEEDLKEYEVHQVDGRITWNPSMEPPEGKKIAIGEKAADLIVESLKRLNDANQLTMEHMTLYEKFIPCTP